MKKQRHTKKLLSMAMLMLGGISTVQAAKLMVNVKDSHGNPLPGAVVEWRQTSGFSQLGTTSVANNGVVSGDIPNGIFYRVKVTYNSTSYEMPVAKNSGIATSENNEEFKTSEVKVVAQSGGLPAAGILVSFVNGYPLGSNIQAESTGTNGIKCFEVFPFDNLKIKAKANQFGSIDSAVIKSFPYGTLRAEVVFDNLVKMQSPNTTFLVGSSWPSGNGGYLFPGTYQIRVNNTYSSNVTLAGSLFDKVPCVVLVKDHNNNPVQGAPVRGGYGTILKNGAFGWWCASTDKNGVSIDWVNSGYDYKTCSYEANVNGTTAAQTKDVTATNGNVFTFKTNELTLKLQDCNKQPVNIGSARYGIGDNYSTWYVPGLKTDNGGISTMEAFPGSYSFELGVNQSTQVLPIDFNGSNGLTWTTTKVTLDWPYAVAYGGDGNADWFPNKAGTQMLPGTYNFRFDGPYGSGSSISPITVSGCSVNKFAVAVRLIKSDNSPIANGQPYCNGIKMPVTNESGNSIVLMDANPYSVVTKMFYEQGEDWKQEDNPAANRIITFKTIEVTVDLNAPNQDVYFRYTGPGFGMFGTTGIDGMVKKQLLPLPTMGNYEFTPASNTSLRVFQDVKVNPLVTFGGALTRMSHNNMAPAAVSFYPNPATSSLNISMPAAGSVEILSIDGRKLAQYQVAEGNSTMDVSALPAGNHMMIVNYNGKNETYKFVKQ
jgi:hypothetical protein